MEAQVPSMHPPLVGDVIQGGSGADAAAAMGGKFADSYM